MDCKKVVIEKMLEIGTKLVVTEGLPVNWQCVGSVNDSADNSYFVTFRKLPGHDFSNIRNFQDAIIPKVTYVELYPEYETSKSAPRFKECALVELLLTGYSEVTRYFNTQKVKRWHFTERVKLVFTTYVPLKKRIPVLAGYDLSERNANFDKILVVAGKKFYIKKAVLCSYSPFFDNLFNNEHFEESKKDEIELKELDPKEFEVFLNVIYPTSTNVNAENVAFLWKLADRFDVTCIAQMCESFICNIQGADSDKFSMTERMEMAHKYNSSKLMKILLEAMGKMNI